MQPISGLKKAAVCCGWLLLMASACGDSREPSASTQTPAVTTPPSPPSTEVEPVPTTSPPEPTVTGEENVTVVQVTVREGRAVSDDRVEVNLGDMVSMRFDSDTPLLVHVHGFDREFPVEAGIAAVHEFEARIPGVFEVEDHLTHRLLVELQVNP